jgi:hypothetical protein
MSIALQIDVSYIILQNVNPLNIVLSWSVNVKCQREL